MVSNKFMLIFHNLFYLGEYSIFAFDTIFEIFFFFKTDFSSSSILKQLSLIFINLNLIFIFFSRTFQCEFLIIFVIIVIFSYYLCSFRCVLWDFKSLFYMYFWRATFSSNFWHQLKICWHFPGQLTMEDPHWKQRNSPWHPQNKHFHHLSHPIFWNTKRTNRITGIPIGVSSCAQQGVT